MKIGFDNEKYLKIQSEHIKERISKFDGKLYLELGGKLFDDHHASRVLPGFQPDSKLRMFQKISDSIEIVIVISAADIEKNKKRADLGITYDEDVLRLRGHFLSSASTSSGIALLQAARFSMVKPSISLNLTLPLATSSLSKNASTLG